MSKKKFLNRTERLAECCYTTHALRVSSSSCAWVGGLVS